METTLPAPPPAVNLRSRGGSTEIILRVSFAKWYRIALWSLIPAVILGMPVIAISLWTHVSSGRLINWPYLSIELLLGFVLLALLLLGFLGFAVSLLHGRVVFDGQSLLLQHDAARFSIPVTNIQAIRSVVLPTHHIDFDPSRPAHLLFLRERTPCLEIDVPEGRLQFFQARSSEKLRYVAECLNILLGLDSHRTPRNLPIPATVVRADVHTRRGARTLKFAGLLIPSVIAVVIAWNFVPAWRSRSWPSVEGHVLHSRWEKQYRDQDTQYIAEISYKYLAAYHSYSNNRIGFGRDVSAAAVRDLVVSHPSGSAIRVYYDPRDPAQSALLVGVGPVLWLLAAMAAFGASLLCCASLFIYVPRPLEEALTRKYRSRISRSERPLTLDDTAGTLCWKAPLTLYEISHQHNRRKYLWASARTLVICLLVYYATYRYFSPWLPDIFQHMALNWIMIGTSLVGAAIVALPALIRGNPAEYRVTADGVYVSSRRYPRTAYRMFDSFTISSNRIVQEYLMLNLHGKDGSSQRIPLPEERSLADEIVAAVSERLPLRPPAPPYSPIQTSDWLLAIALIVPYMVALGSLTHRFHHFLRAYDLMGLLPIVLLVLGPGSIAACFLIRRRGRGSLIAFAGAMNLISFVAVPLYLALG